jgi:cobalt-zinc-cadmium efflux system outer membrane protein
MNRLTTLVAFISIATTSFAADKSEQAFRDLAEAVHARTGKRVIWNRGTTQDAEAEAFVQSLFRRSLTADSAVQIALLNNRNLQATYEDIGVGQGDLIDAGLLRNPLFEIERRFPGRALEADMFAEFIDLLLLPLRKRAAKAEFEAVKLRVAHEILLQTGDVRAAFYEHQGDLQLVDLSRTVTKTSEESAAAALRLHEAGNTPDLDLANEQALHVQTKLDLATAQSTAVESREKLSSLMGAWGAQTQWKMPSRLPELPPNDIAMNGLESRAISQRFDLSAARQAAIAQGRTAGYAAIGAIFDQVEVGAHYEREPEGNKTSGPSFKIPIPLFNFGQGTNVRAKAKFRQNQQKYFALAVQIRSEVRAARDKLLLARQRAEYIESTVMPLRSRILQETQLQYNAMHTGVFDLLRAKQEEVSAGKEHVEALRGYWVARAELEKAVGGSLSGKSSSSSSKKIVRKKD